jgi:hypothetical protein
MRQSRVTGPITRPSSGVVHPAPPPMPLEAQLFRPRGSLAASVLVGPSLVLLAVLALARITGVMVPWLVAVCAGLGALWLVGCLALASWLLLTVRASSEGLEARTPWDGRRLLRWQLIENVERRNGLLRLRSSDGKRLMFLEIGLTHSRQLLRQILLRVSPTVLSAPLQQDLAMLGGPADPNAEYVISVAPVWLLGAGGVGALGVALALWGHFGGGMPLLIVGVVLAALGAGVLLLLRQTITITETHLTLARGFGKPRTLEWDEIGVVDTMPLDLALGLRSGDHRTIFLGPFFFAPLRAELVRSTIRARVLDRGTPIFQAWRIW